MMFFGIICFAGGFVLGCIFPSDLIRERVRNPWAKKESVPEEDPLRMPRMTVNARQPYSLA